MRIKAKTKKEKLVKRKKQKRRNTLKNLTNDAEAERRNYYYLYVFTADAKCYSVFMDIAVINIHRQKSSKNSV